MSERDSYPCVCVDEARAASAGAAKRDVAPPPIAPQSAADPDVGWPLLERSPNPLLTFDTLVPCKVNDFPLELAQLAATRRGEHHSFNPCYIYGEVGTGKTHILSAIANAAGPRKARLVNTADLEAELERAMRLARRAELRTWLASTDILLIDDIQLCEKNESLQNEVFAVVNHMIRDGKALVITSDVSPTRLRHVTSRLLSRLGAGVVVGLGVGNLQERMAIVRRHAGDRPISEPVVSYLAEQISDSVRRLKAAVTQVLAHAAHAGIEVDLDLARAIAPRPEDIRAVLPEPAPSGEPVKADSAGAVGKPGQADMAERFKRMLRGAETPEEQALALEIAMSEGIRTLRAQGSDPERLAQLEVALAHLREGNLDQALQGISF